MARSMLPDASEADEAAEEMLLLALQSLELFPSTCPSGLHSIAWQRIGR